MLSVVPVGGSCLFVAGRRVSLSVLVFGFGCCLLDVGVVCHSLFYIVVALLCSMLYIFSSPEMNHKCLLMKDLRGVAFAAKQVYFYSFHDVNTD